MKLEIYDDTTPELEKIVRLRLVRGGPGIIKLVVVSDDGERLPCGTILSLVAGGRIHREVRVDPDCGFELDGEGRVKTN